MTRASPLIIARWAVDIVLRTITPQPSMIKNGRVQYRLSDWSLGGGHGTEWNSLGVLEGEKID